MFVCVFVWGGGGGRQTGGRGSICPAAAAAAAGIAEAMLQGVSNSWGRGHDHCKECSQRG